MRLCEAFEITARDGETLHLLKGMEGEWWMADGPGAVTPSGHLPQVGEGWAIEAPRVWPPERGSTILVRSRPEGAERLFGVIDSVRALGAVVLPDDAVRSVDRLGPSFLASPPDGSAAVEAETLVHATDLGLDYAGVRRAELLADLTCCPEADAGDYVGYVVEPEVEMAGEVEGGILFEAWTAALTSGEAEEDPRVQAFLAAYRASIEEIRASILERRRLLAEFLGEGEEEVQIRFLGPYPGLYVFGSDDDLYVVVMEGEEWEFARMYAADNLDLFLRRPDLIDHTVIPEGAESVLEAIRALEPDLACEMLHGVLIDEASFVERMVVETGATVEMTTAGLATDGVVFDGPSGVKVIRVLDLDEGRIEYREEDEDTA
jgi:hypothetical protein